MNHRSLAFRLAVWYALLLTATFALVGAGMCYGLEQYLRSNLRDSLRRRSVQVQQILEQAPAGVSDRAIAEAIDTRVAPDFNNRFVRVTRAPATLVYRSGVPADRSFDPAVVPSQTNPWPSKAMANSIATLSGQLMISLTPIDTASGRYLMELGTALGPIEALQHRLLSLLAVMLPVLVACAAGGGYLLVQRALQPVERMSQTAERISVQDLEARLPVAATGDALQRLSISFNHLLGRLRDSVFTSRRFLADASHELRTPLTIIKGELQEVLAHEAGHSELGERIGSVLEEVARLEHLVSGLLVLSRLDAGEARREWVDVNLGELAADTVEHMRLVAEDRGVQLQAAALAPVTLRGDARRLKQVIVNLLDNAIKFTPRGGVVGVSTQQREGFGLLEVSDSGIGIPPDSLPHVFDRFYRVDAARSREDGGAGLGLSIVRSICGAHGAEIEVESTPGSGSRFRVTFPQPAAFPLPDTEMPGAGNP
ncbi:MAG TPA: ATP-binding protein [Steroidobacteraceae bacterium]|jgi:heavy metal sensor kinase|nr:ATP-binding protein [Steroidobacteraceae bacterium]